MFVSSHSSNLHFMEQSGTTLQLEFINSLLVFGIVVQIGFYELSLLVRPRITKTSISTMWTKTSHAPFLKHPAHEGSSMLRE